MYVNLIDNWLLILLMQNQNHCCLSEGWIVVTCFGTSNDTPNQSVMIDTVHMVAVQTFILHTVPLREVVWPRSLSVAVRNAAETSACEVFYTAFGYSPLNLS